MYTSSVLATISDIQLCSSSALTISDRHVHLVRTDINIRHVHLPVRSGNNIRQTCTLHRPFWQQYQTDMYTSPSVLATISDRHVHLTVRSGNNIRQTCTPHRPFWQQYQTDMYTSPSVLATISDRHAHIPVCSGNNIRQICTPPSPVWHSLPGLPAPAWEEIHPDL